MHTPGLTTPVGLKLRLVPILTLMRHDIAAATKVSLQTLTCTIHILHSDSHIHTHTALLHTYQYTKSHVCSHTHLVNTYSPTHIYVHTHIHTHIYSHTHPHTHVHTHTHPHTPGPRTLSDFASFLPFSVICHCHPTDSNHSGY